MAAAKEEPQGHGRLLATLLRHLPVAVAMLDRNMCYLQASDRWRSDYGLGSQPILGRSHYELFPDLPERWRELHRRGLEGEILRADEDFFERASGERVWLRWEIHPWGQRDGRPEGIFIFTEDITQRKLAEEALQASNARLKATLASMSDAVFISDAEGRFIQFNAAFAKFHKFANEEECGRTLGEFSDLLEIFRPDGQLLPLDQWAVPRALRGEVGTGIEYSLRRKDTGESWIGSYSFSPIRDARGRIVGSVVNARDITEQKRRQRELDALNAEMEQVTRFHIAAQTVAAIAHELNQPLVAVSSYSEAALRLLHAGEVRSAKLETALVGSAEQAQRAGRIMRELLGVLNMKEIQTELVDLNALVRRVVDAVKGRHPREFETRLELDPALPTVRANRLQIEKVLANLIENGIEAMRAAGPGPHRLSVGVRTSAGSDMAQTTVRDSGKGVDEAIRHRIFHPFFTTKPSGLGMGLAVSRAIVEAHGGQLWLDPEQNAGAAFHFTLPFAT